MEDYKTFGYLVNKKQGDKQHERRIIKRFN